MEKHILLVMSSLCMYNWLCTIFDQTLRSCFSFCWDKQKNVASFVGYCQTLTKSLIKRLVFDFVLPSHNHNHNDNPIKGIYRQLRNINFGMQPYSNLMNYLQLEKLTPNLTNLPRNKMSRNICNCENFDQ